MIDSSPSIPSLHPDDADWPHAEAWPVLPGAPSQRDAAFVRALIEAQLAARRTRS
jgi:hypothetical protein